MLSIAQKDGSKELRIYCYKCYIHFIHKCYIHVIVYVKWHNII